MKRTLVMFAAAAAACSRSAPPNAEPPPSPKSAQVVVDAAVAARSGSASSSGSGSGSGSVVYREQTSTFHVVPELVGTGKKYMVVSESAEASAVGKAILARGGNAVDAAVATAFALAVVHPSAGNLAGGGFAVVRPKTGPETTLDFRETAPKAATRDMYLDAKGAVTSDSLVGHRASGVPGAVAGLYELHHKLGKLPWKDVVAPAIALARDGFALEAAMHEGIERRADCLGKFPASAAIWLVDKHARATNDKITIPDLATTLQRIADHGPDGFYLGDTAKLIVAEMKSGNGLITADDLAGYKAIWRQPLVTHYRGYTFVTMPPPSSGGIVLALTANMLRGTDLAKLGWHSTEHVHKVVEVWRRAFAARNELLGDPAFVLDMPVDKLMSTDYADKLGASIGSGATPSKDVTQLIEGTHTTNLSVVDGDGAAVALTTTLNTSFGSCVTVTGAGFLMNNEMDDFTAKPGSPNTFGLVQGKANEIAPGKRMLSSMSPTIVEDDKHAVFAVAGAGGGPRIITGVWQVLSNVVDFKMAGDAAVGAPRFHHQHLPDVVRVEADSIEHFTAEALKREGYTLDFSEGGRAFASVTAIVRTADGWLGAADPHGGAGGAMGD